MLSWHRWSSSAKVLRRKQLVGVADLATSWLSCETVVMDFFATGPENEAGLDSVESTEFQQQTPTVFHV